LTLRAILSNLSFDEEEEFICQENKQYNYTKYVKLTAVRGVSAAIGPGV